MHLWPDSLAGRTVVLLIGMTLLLITGSAILLHDERNERFDERNRFRLQQRVSTLVRLLSDADADERQRIIDRIAERGDDITLSEEPLVVRAPSYPIEHKISHKLLRTLDFLDPESVRVRVAFDRNGRARRDDDQPERREWESRYPRAHVHGLKDIAISVRLEDDLWLNIRLNSFDGPPPWAGKTLQLLALLLVFLIVSGLLITRRMARPMSQLAEAADRFGLGHSQAPLSEVGPREVRQTIRAFNRMQERLHKHITDRSRMLAAVSHDLRTPITTLRLRAEYISDPEIRERTLETLAEMESILSAALSF
ncbi:MAG: HAMP domain-containing protein, partial [Gammaproteobacteria bacterium]|nr:HAMP domain-containing protein [Gammaproteobacteria bacterium]